jgi:serine/threonine protein kinase
VLDFGLVKSRTSAEESRITREGVTTGTPAYMAPEMAIGNADVDSRSDIYSLGCVAYWLLTGSLVFDAGNALSMALAHVREAPVPPSQRTEIEVPPDLEAVIMDCLQKDQARRPQTARELDRLLATCAAASSWDNDHAEEWWRMHLPNQAQCGKSGRAPELLETAPTVTS